MQNMLHHASRWKLRRFAMIYSINYLRKEVLPMMQNKVTVKQRKFRKLEELNLIDNFLFQEMLSQKDIGEEFVFARHG